MTAALAALYPWVKSLHLISVIAWMAGLLYLPRLYVYHADAPIGSDCAAIFEIMERRLLRGIMVPALAMTYLFGILLGMIPGVVDWQAGWIWAKLALVLSLTGFQLVLARWRRIFAAGRIPHPARFFRAVNELPTMAMILIVIFVVVRPF